LETHIEGLAYIGVYVGHKCNLFSDGFDAKALVTAAQRRWNHIGEYSWQIPTTLSEEIMVELSGEARMDVVAGPIDVTTESTVDALMELQQQPVFVPPAQRARTTSASEGVYTPAYLNQEVSNNHSGNLSIADFRDAGK